MERKPSGNFFRKFGYTLRGCPLFWKFWEMENEKLGIFMSWRREVTTKKCTKKRDARAKLLFCLINLFLFTPSRCSCLSSLMRRLSSQSLLYDDDDFYYYRISQVYVRSIGTLRNYDGDGNGNVKKAIGLMSKTTILHVHHAFLYISLPSLHN